MTTDRVTIGDATLYLGDCREILPTLDATCAIVSDPPYGINFNRTGGGGELAIASSIEAVGRQSTAAASQSSAMTGLSIPRRCSDSSKC